MHLIFSGQLYHATSHAWSDEQTRYYLIGTYVEPHPVQGVTLTATNGHILVCVHDENGSADNPAIVRVPKEALRACAGKRGKVGPSVMVKDGVAKVLASSEIVSTECIVDGTFPDWRRIIPAVPKAWSAPDGYGTTVLRVLSRIGDELAAIGERFPSKRGTPMRVLSPSDQGLALWPNIPHAFGVVMPMRANNNAVALPAWFGPPLQQAA